MSARWTMSRDGVARTEVRITHRLSFDDLASVLAFALERGTTDAANLTAAQVREEVRMVLEVDGHAARETIIPESEHYDAVRRAFGQPS